MKLRALAAMLCFALGACAQSETSNGASESAATQAPAPAATQAMLGGCTFPNFWAFHGSCAIGHIPASGGTVVLPQYRRMTVTIGFGENSATSPTSIVLADAIGSDITGKLNGVLPFPLYGSVPCITPDNAAAPCPGKAVLYLLFVNNGAEPVTMKSSASIAISGMGTLNGLKTCTKSTLMWSGEKARPAAWIVRKWYARLYDLRTEFAPIDVPQLYANHGAFTIFAVTCT